MYSKFNWWYICLFNILEFWKHIFISIQYIDLKINSILKEKNKNYSIIIVIYFESNESFIMVGFKYH